ncbi:hypothetical protein FRC11_012077, partial [Ceratobasidium sp. 423]
MSVEPPSPQASRTSNLPKNNAKGKGKAAPVVTKGGQVLSPIDETESFLIYPGLRPESNDPIELDVLIEEWKCQHLIWYLVYHDQKIIDPTTDYDDLKRVLGSDQGWDSENEELDGQVSQPSGPQTTTSVSHGGTCISQFDKEPPARKLVKVQALPLPPPPPTKSQSNAASKGGPQTMTSTAKHPVSTEPEHSPKLGATSKLASQPQLSHGTSQENRPAQAQASSNCRPPQAPAPTVGQSSSQAAANPKHPPQAPAPGGQNFPQAYTSRNPDHKCHSALAPPPASGQSMSQAPTCPNRPPPQPIVPTGSKHRPPQATSHSGGHAAPQAPAESHCRPPPPGTNFDHDHHSQAPGPHTGSRGASAAPEHCPPQNPKHAPSLKWGECNMTADWHIGVVMCCLVKFNCTEGAPPHTTPSTTSNQDQEAGEFNPGGEAPQTGQGQDQELDGDVDGDGDGQDEPTDKQHQSGSHGRLKDYAGIEKSLLKWASEVYRVLMAVDGMYETDVDVLDQCQREAWQMALDRYEVNKADYPLTQAHVQSLIDRVISWHGHACKQVKDHVMYNFFGKKVMKMLKTPEELNAYIKKLKNGGLHTKPRAHQGTGYFQHPILQLCMDNILFRHHKDLGVLFVEKFHQPTAQLIGFFCATVQSLIETRALNSGKNDSLDFEEQWKAYLMH